MTGFSQNVDERVVNKLHDLVGEGVQSVRDMARHIRIYVKNDLFRSSSIPPSANRRFNPTLKDVRNHMYKAPVKHKFSKLDQTNQDLKVQEWKRQQQNDNFFFRGYGEKFSHDEEVTDMECEEIKV